MPAKSLTPEQYRRYGKSYRARKKAAGKCVACGCHSAPNPGNTMCKFHLRDMAKRNTERRAKKKAAGICINSRCWEKAYGTVYCQEHRVKNFGVAPDSVPYRIAREQRMREFDEEQRQRKASIRPIIEMARQVLTRMQFSTRTTDMIVRFYGLNEGPETLEEIGQRYDITRERVRQLIAPFRPVAEELGLLIEFSNGGRYTNKRKLTMPVPKPSWYH